MKIFISIVPSIAVFLLVKYAVVKRLYKIISPLQLGLPPCEGQGSSCRQADVQRVDAVVSVRSDAGWLVAELAIVDKALRTDL